MSSSSCLVIQHLTTLPYITTYLCAFWTALLVITKGPWMSQIVSLQAHLSLWARFSEIYLHSVTLYYLSPKKDMFSTCFCAIPFMRSGDFSTPISRLTETFSRLLLFIHRGMCYDVVLVWQKRVVILSNNLLMFCVLVFHFRNEL